MIFLIIWPLLIHSSQQPSNLRDKHSRLPHFLIGYTMHFWFVCRQFPFSIVYEEILVLTFFYVEARYSKIGRLDSHWGCLFFTQKYNFDRVFLMALRITHLLLSLIHMYRRSRLHGVNELMLRVYFQRKHLTFVARVTKYIRLFTLKNT